MKACMAPIVWAPWHIRRKLCNLWGAVIAPINAIQHPGLVQRATGLQKQTKCHELFATLVRQSGADNYLRNNGTTPLPTTHVMNTYKVMHALRYLSNAVLRVCASGMNGLLTQLARASTPFYNSPAAPYNNNAVMPACTTCGHTAHLLPKT